MGRIWGAPWGILAASESALDGPLRLDMDNEMYRPFRRQSNDFQCISGGRWERPGGPDHVFVRSEVAEDGFISLVLKSLW